MQGDVPCYSYGLGAVSRCSACLAQRPWAVGGCKATADPLRSLLMTTKPEEDRSPAGARVPLREEGGPKPPPASVALVKELFSTWGQTWKEPLPEPLPRPQRFFYAFAGALPWLFVNLGSAEWISLVQALDFALLLTVSFQPLLAAWFAWLIAYQERPCSPSRFFLEGLLFPGIAAALLTNAYLGG